MATAKGRGGAASKSAASKASTKKSTGAKSAASSSRGNGASKATASKKSAANSKSAASKKSVAPSKGAAAAKGPAAKKGVAVKSTASKKSVSARGSNTAGARGGASGNGRAAASSRGRATASAGRGTAASRNASSRATSSSRGKSKAASADPRNDLAKILEDLMKDIYYAEKKLSKALGKMARNATNPQLKEAFTTHQSQTEEQVSKLEQAFEAIGAKAKAKKCAAMDGLLEEADEHLEEYEKGAGLDAALIVGAQKVEHYEIAAYGSMRSIARTLGHTEAARIFEEIREQESDTDELLTTIAESVVNLTAEDETENVEGEGSSRGKGGFSRKGSEDSDAGEDSSSRTSGNEAGADNNDGAGRGISAMTDGNDRGETGEAMGY